MFQAPDRATLAVLDLIGAGIFGLFAVVFFAVWLYTEKTDRYSLALSALFSMMALRLISSFQIRLIFLWGLFEIYDVIWRWSAFVVGVGLIVAAFPPLWIFLGESFREAVAGIFKRITKALR